MGGTFQSRTGSVTLHAARQIDNSRALVLYRHSSAPEARPDGQVYLSRLIMAILLHRLRLSLQSRRYPTHDDTTHPSASEENLLTGLAMESNESDANGNISVDSMASGTGPECIEETGSFPPELHFPGSSDIATPDTTPEHAPVSSSHQVILTEDLLLASHRQIGSVSLIDFLETVVDTDDGAYTKRNIATAFIELSNSEREDLGLAPHSVSEDINAPLMSKSVLKKIKIGTIKLGDFLDLVPFDGDVTTVAALRLRFNAAFDKEQTTLAKVGQFLV
ncbi:hypothetical protein M011DRAFT_202175 [Sporormia fimetaria CBS 119925]|uniref:Uncharacterized protein n=1 Tax=Sporormia fimetaria CBS 119925 TaxID=1340428 RepID=A0A6A6V334_9PLEO|nr:hypothetical protein M011DRAFT_202175 [Sporormia fimetaria CBS 119925]